jgi:BlaR1 peptidase M56
VLGVFRPRIVLPRWLAAGPDRVRSTVVAHELEHIAARDQVFIVAAQLVTVLLPWNLPLCWFARRLRAAIEVDCDARVLRRGVDPGHYADVLLAVGQRRSSSPYLAATLIEPVTQLERRIRIMLTPQKPGAARRAAAAAALALAMAACVSRVEPPVVMTSSEPSADAAEESASGNSSTVFLLPFLGRTPKREPSDGIEPKTEDLVFEGHVVFEFDGTSITATRAVAKEGADGRMTLTLEDAVVTVGPSGAGADNEPTRTESSR